MILIMILKHCHGFPLTRLGGLAKTKIHVFVFDKVDKEFKMWRKERGRKRNKKKIGPKSERKL